ncbi:MAG: glutaredoxin family protein [Anaerolineae bacterium]|nr:glutaredoxin family protein [Caldilineales bacterium]MCX7851600.1 glutaredoxin family protein [Caldilineales bacterium]MDW8269439.1 glutaredoxin family protein [Anaerolineae bacterium]
MTLPITLYGSTHCDDTERTRHHLQTLGVPFTEVNIDHDLATEQFVIVINRGYRSTPTLVIGNGKTKLILTEPTDDELSRVLAQAETILQLAPTP